MEVMQCCQHRHDINKLVYAQFRMTKAVNTGQCMTDPIKSALVVHINSTETLTSLCSVPRGCKD